MAFDNTDFDFDEDPAETADPAPAEQEPNNRPFWIALGALAGLFLLTLICIVGFLFLRPLLTGGNGVGSAQETQAAEINTQNAIMAGTATQARMIAAWTQTPSPTLPQPSATTRPATATPVLAQNSPTPLGMVNSRTATVSALLTLAATSQKASPTATRIGGAGTPTQLPDSGLADDLGIPGLVALAVILVGVIFLTRRLRS